MYPKIKVIISSYSLQRDAGSRSVRLQRGAAHIQRSTDSASVGCHGYDLVFAAVGSQHAQGAAATDTPRLASSRYRLARLRADRALPLHLCLIQLEMIFSLLIGNQGGHTS